MKAGAIGVRSGDQRTCFLCECVREDLVDKKSVRCRGRLRIYGEEDRVVKSGSNSLDDLCWNVEKGMK